MLVIIVIAAIVLFIIIGIKQNNETVETNDLRILYNRELESIKYGFRDGQDYSLFIGRILPQYYNDDDIKLLAAWNTDANKILIQYLEEYRSWIFNLDARLLGWDEAAKRHLDEDGYFYVNNIPELLNKKRTKPMSKSDRLKLFGMYCGADWEGSDEAKAREKR